MRPVALIPLVALALGGCARSGGAPQTTPAPSAGAARGGADSGAVAQTGARPSKRNAEVITQDEIASISARTALDVIQKLRPQFLRTRGAVSVTDPTPLRPIVYIDNVSVGGLEALNRVPASTISEIRYLDANEATMRFGTGHGGGAILVRTRS